MKKCTKCDDRGHIKIDEYSSRSCDCGKYQRQMKGRFKGVSIEQLLSYANKKINQKQNV